MKGIFLFGMLLGSFCCASQQKYFNNRYNFYNKSDGALHILETDNGYIAVGGAEDSTAFPWYLRLAVLFIDKDGNEMSKKSFGKSGYNYYSGLSGSFINTSDGGYALGGSIQDTSGNSDGLIIKFDVNADTLWTRQYGSSAYEAFFQCRQTTDGGFILVGTTTQVDTDGDILLVKTDSSGNIQWDKTYGGNLRENGLGIHACNDNGYIITGFTESYGAGGTDIYVIKTDSYGGIKWNKTFGDIYDDGSSAVIQLNDGNYLVGGALGKEILSGSYTQRNPYLLKLDSTGTKLWDKIYGAARYVTGLTVVHELSDGNIIAGGQRSNLNGTPTGNGWAEGLLLKVNQDGDSLWYRIYEHNPCEKNFDYLRDMKPTADGSFITAGFIVPNSTDCPGDTGNQDMWLMKVDSCGCLYPGCDSVCAGLLGIDEQKFEENEIKVFPNPANRAIIITGYNLGIARFNLYDITGKMLFRKKFLPNENIILEDFSPGLYFYTVDADGNTVSKGKLIIEK